VEIVSQVLVKNCICNQQFESVSFRFVSFIRKDSEVVSQQIDRLMTRLNGENNNQV